MSRSYKKYPTFSSSSEKDDKRHNNRRLRRKIKHAIFNDDEVMPIMNEVSDPWNMAKDGKMLVPEDSDWYEKARRK